MVHQMSGSASPLAAPGKLPKYRLAVFQGTDFMQQQDSSHQSSYKGFNFNPDF